MARAAPPPCSPGQLLCSSVPQFPSLRTGEDAPLPLIQARLSWGSSQSRTLERACEPLATESRLRFGASPFGALLSPRQRCLSSLLPRAGGQRSPVPAGRGRVNQRPGLQEPAWVALRPTPPRGLSSWRAPSRPGPEGGGLKPCGWFGEAISQETEPGLVLQGPGRTEGPETGRDEVPRRMGM